MASCKAQEGVKGWGSAEGAGKLPTDLCLCQDTFLLFAIFQTCFGNLISLIPLHILHEILSLTHSMGACSPGFGCISTPAETDRRPHLFQAKQIT